MAKRIILKLGDVFVVKINEAEKKYFQYVGSDSSQLDSDVVKLFIRAYPIDIEPDFDAVVNGEVDSYLHTFVRWGVKEGVWERVGNRPPSDLSNVWFRTCHYTKFVEKSDDWWVWQIGQPEIHVGKLPAEYIKAHIGLIVQVETIVTRLQTGKWDYVYPGY